MDELKFKIGDVVKLKSGGPNLTVIEIRDTWDVSVNWITESGMWGCAKFPEICLVLVERNEDGNGKLTRSET